MAQSWQTDAFIPGYGLHAVSVRPLLSKKKKNARLCLSLSVYEKVENERLNKGA